MSVECTINDLTADLLFAVFKHLPLEDYVNVRSLAICGPQWLEAVKLYRDFNRLCWLLEGIKDQAALDAIEKEAIRDFKSCADLVEIIKAKKIL